MATRPEGRSTELKLDPTALFLEEVFTDRRVGTIRRFSPVTKDAAPTLTARSSMSARLKS